MKDHEILKERKKESYKIFDEIAPTYDLKKNEKKLRLGGFL